MNPRNGNFKAITKNQFLILNIYFGLHKIFHLFIPNLSLFTCGNFWVTSHYFNYHFIVHLKVFFPIFFKYFVKWIKFFSSFNYHQFYDSYYFNHFTLRVIFGH